MITVGPTKLPCSQPGTTTVVPSRERMAPPATCVGDVQLIGPACSDPSVNDARLGVTDSATIFRARCLASGLIMGPTSVEGSAPRPTLSAIAFLTNCSSRELASPTSTTTLIAMHRWPAAPNAAPTIPLSAYDRRYFVMARKDFTVHSDEDRGGLEWAF